MILGLIVSALVVLVAVVIATLQAAWHNPRHVRMATERRMADAHRERRL